MADVIVTIPGATNVTVDDAPATSVVVIFPASNYVVTTVIDRGILFGIEGPSGPAGGVDTVNGQSGNVTLDTSEIPENPTALYFTAARVRDAILTGLSTATNAIISATDSVLVAFGKLQAQITANLSTLSSHISNTSNPHSVTKSQVGLGNVLDVDTTNANNISSGTLNDARLSANVTLQGNTFNAASKLVQLDASAKLPAVDGSNLTNLNIPPSTGGDLYLFYNY